MTIKPGARWDDILLAKIQTLLGERGPEKGRAVLVGELEDDGTSWRTTLAGGFGSLARGALTNLALRFKGTRTGLYLDGDSLIFVVNGVERARFTITGAVVTGLLAGTAVTQSKVDTTAGRLLKVGDFGIGNNAGVADNGTRLANIDAANTPNGIWWTNNTTTGTFPAGETTYGQLIIMRLNLDNACQIWMPIAGDTLYTRRYYQTGGGWQPWRPLLSRHNLLGTVSQTGGVPTGRVIERGSNANGEYVRFADGTQECWFTIMSSAGAAVTWTFPAVFSAPPVVNGSAVSAVLAAVCFDAAPTATTATLSVRDKTDTRRADTIHITAIGRWF